MSLGGNTFKLLSAGRSISLLKSHILTAENAFKVPHRTAMILKRRNGLPPWVKDYMDYNRLNTFEPQYQEYDEVGDDDLNPKEPIKVLLTEFVEDIGKRGQIVELDPIDAYQNYIILGRAVYATPYNIQKQRVLSESEIDKHSTISAYKTQKILSRSNLSVYMNMYEPWTIQPWHIRATLRSKGVHVLNDSLIEMPETPINGPDLKLEGKDFAVRITINNCEKFWMRCRLRHWTKIFSEKIVLPPNHECVPSEAILPEQAEILANIPLPEYIEEKKLS